MKTIVPNTGLDEVNLSLTLHKICLLFVSYGAGNALYIFHAHIYSVSGIYMHTVYIGLCVQI